MAEDVPSALRVACSCGAKLKVPAKAAGKRVKCPKCQTVLTVPPPPPEESYELAGDDPSALFEQLAEQGRAAPAEGGRRIDAAGQCPQCGAGLPEEAVLCTQCGFNRNTGRSAKAAKAPSKRSGAMTAAAGAVGRTGLGVLFSCIGALIGAGVWYGIAVAAEKQYGWIAWGIGILAGVGMVKGVGGPSARGGLLAAAIAAGGIVLGKLMVYQFVLLPALTGEAEDEEAVRAYVVNMMTLAEFEGKSVVAKDEFERRYKANEERVDAMNAEDLRAARNLFREDGWTIESGSGLFFSTMFGWRDIIFVGLALVTAFRLGGSGLSGGD